MGIFLAVLSAIFYGSADFAGGIASRRSPTTAVVVVSQLFGAAIALAMVAMEHTPPPAPADLGWGAAAGLVGVVGLLALYEGIARGIIALVSPIAAVLGAVIPLGYGLAQGEHPPAAAWIGVALCLPATLLLAGSGATMKDGKQRVARSLVAACVAGAGFGLFFIFISRPAHVSGFWPLVAARMISVAAVASVAALRGVHPFSVGTNLPVVVVAGVLDMGANIAFVLAARAGMLGLVTVIASLYPGVTVACGAAFLKERLTPRTVAGICLALAGVALIAAA